MLWGCHEKNPIELVDEGGVQQTLEVENSPAMAVPFDMEGKESTSFFITGKQQYYGQLVIARSIFDSPLEHHEASLARAIFVDRTNPLLSPWGDTLTFKSIDVGTVTIDNLLLSMAIERLNFSGIVDDTVGPYYALLNKDGVGGKGFQYYGNHAYQWDINGSVSFSYLQESITSPPEIRMTSPISADGFTPSKNLSVRWEGGSNNVRIIISDIREDALPRPLIQMKVGRNTGQAVVPASILRLLPKSRTRFLFTISSENVATTHHNGYNDEIIIRAVTNHSLVLQVLK